MAIKKHDKAKIEELLAENAETITYYEGIIRGARSEGYSERDLEDEIEGLAAAEASRINLIWLLKSAI